MRADIVRIVAAVGALPRPPEALFEAKVGLSCREAQVGNDDRVLRRPRLNYMRSMVRMVLTIRSMLAQALCGHLRRPWLPAAASVGCKEEDVVGAVGAVPVWEPAK